MSTLLNSPIAAPPGPSLVGQTIAVCWPSTRMTVNGSSARMQQVEFVLSLRVQTRDRLTVEAWIENGSQRDTVLTQQSAQARMLRESNALHIDVSANGDDGQARLAAISIVTDDAGGQRLLYAQTPLLSRGGFTAASYDAPKLRPAS